MDCNTVALDSLPSILLPLSDLVLLFLFILSMKFSVPYVLLIFPLSETLKLPFRVLLAGVRRALPARSQRGKGDQSVFTCRSTWLNQNTTWSKNVSSLSFEVRSPLVGLIRCGRKHRWVKYSTSQAVSGKANLTHLCIPHLVA